MSYPLEAPYLYTFTSNFIQFGFVNFFCNYLNIKKKPKPQIYKLFSTDNRFLHIITLS